MNDEPAKQSPQPALTALRLRTGLCFWASLLSVNCAEEILDLALTRKQCFDAATGKQRAGRSIHVGDRDFRNGPAIDDVLGLVKRDVSFRRAPIQQQDYRRADRGGDVHWTSIVRHKHGQTGQRGRQLRNRKSLDNRRLWWKCFSQLRQQWAFF